MKKIRVLLADDHKIVLEGLKKMLDSAVFDLLGAVEDGRALVTETLRLRPDVVVVDISMPMLNGIEAVRQIKKADGGIKIVFLTMHPEVTYASRAFDAGASGYVLKHSAPAELTIAIKEAAQGRSYITPLIAGELLSAFRKIDPKKDLLKKITQRQREVLQLLAEGKSAKEVATFLNISHRTIEFHKYRMMQDLKLKSSADLVRFAVKTGVVV